MRARNAVQPAIDPIASLYVGVCMALARKKSGALVARRIVRPAFTSKLVALARGRCLAENTVTPAIADSSVWNSGIGGVSGEAIIPPASQAGGELLHRPRAQKDRPCTGHAEIHSNSTQQQLGSVRGPRSNRPIRNHYAMPPPLIAPRAANGGNCWRMSRAGGRSDGSRPIAVFNSARSMKASA